MTSTSKRFRMDRRAFSSTWKVHTGALPAKSSQASYSSALLVSVPSGRSLGVLQMTLPQVPPVAWVLLTSIIGWETCARPQAWIFTYSTFKRKCFFSLGKVKPSFASETFLSAITFFTWLLTRATSFWSSLIHKFRFFTSQRKISLLLWSLALWWSWRSWCFLWRQVWSNSSKKMK